MCYTRIFLPTVLTVHSLSLLLYSPLLPDLLVQTFPILYPSTLNILRKLKFIILIMIYEYALNLSDLKPPVPIFIPNSRFEYTITRSTFLLLYLIDF